MNTVTEPGGALDEAIALAQRIAANAPVAVQASLAAISAAVSGDDDRGWAATAEAQARIAASADAREGIAAFLERRPPRWTGR